MERIPKRLLIGGVLAVFSIIGSQLSWAYEKEIKALSSSLADGIAQSGKKSVAVVDFTDLQGNVTELGRFLAEEVSGDLTNSARGFEVMDRMHLKSLLEEHKLSMLGLVDPKSLKKVGQITGADVIITGSVTPFGDTIRITCKAIATETARIFCSAKGDIPKTKAIEELLARGIGSNVAIAEKPRTAPSSPTAYPAVTRGPEGKRVGDLSITVKKITTGGDQVNVSLEFFNNSNKTFALGGVWNDPFPILTDDKGTKYGYRTGICRSNNGGEYAVRDIKNCGITLAPKESNDVVISFGAFDYNIKGSIFSFSLHFMVADTETGSFSKHNVSFMDMKANMSR